MNSESTHYECRVYDPKMKLKHVIPPKDCEAHFWRDFTKPKKRFSGNAPLKPKKINCIICGDLVTAYSKNAKKCKKAACKTEYNRLIDKRRKQRKSDINQPLAGK